MRWGLQFHLNKEQVGAIAGLAFLGFTASIFFGGQVVDALGMGRVLGLAFACHVERHRADDPGERLRNALGREHC